MHEENQRSISSKDKIIASWFWWGSILFFSMVVGRIGYDISMSIGRTDVDRVSLMHAYLTAFFYFLMAVFAGAIIGETLSPMAKMIIGVIPCLFSLLYIFGAF